MSKDFLLEIGCEEIPSDYMPSVMECEPLEGSPGLGAAVRAALSDAGVGKGEDWETRLYYTHRRLVLQIAGIPPRIRRQEKGPPIQIAFDPSGKPTRAAEAFSKKHGLRVSELVRRQTPKGEMVFAEYDLPAAKVLAEAIPKIIQGVRFPKTMRWEESGVRFARPIRWILALYGSTPVACSFGPVRSAPFTYGTRRSGGKQVPVRTPAAYFAALRRLKVRLEDNAMSKRGALLAQLEEAARRCGGKLPDRTTEEFNWLLDTVTFLAEEPVVAVGSFRPEYLDLPSEVLATAMAKHLKLFGVRSRAGTELLPKFLAVLEGRPGRPAMVMANVERIIEARFADARFFYGKDTESRLEAKAPELSKVIFHERLGTVAERTQHLAALARSIAQQIGLRVDASLCEKAARVCKADLVTHMVREFPSLQGTMGGHYARHDGEPEEVAAAIAQHYWPRTAADPIPATPLGAVLSLADRLDTLVGYFGVGLRPTGSADPYSLRRQAQGLIRILIEPPRGVSFVGLSIDRLSDESIESWGPRIEVRAASLKRELHAFLRERLEWLCSFVHRIDPCLLDAVLAADSDDLSGSWERLQILKRLWSGAGDGSRRMLERAAKVAERTGRIVNSVKDSGLPPSVNAEALKESAEKELWERWSRIALQVKQQLEQRRYEEATKTYSALYPAVHTFFEKVFVMDENLELRRNRLALLKEIHQSLAGSFADLSKLPLPGALEN